MYKIKQKKMKSLEPDVSSLLKHLTKQMCFFNALNESYICGYKVKAQ